MRPAHRIYLIIRLMYGKYLLSRFDIRCAVSRFKDSTCTLETHICLTLSNVSNILYLPRFRISNPDPICRYVLKNSINYSAFLVKLIRQVPRKQISLPFGFRKECFVAH